MIFTLALGNAVAIGVGCSPAALALFMVVCCTVLARSLDQLLSLNCPLTSTRPHFLRWGLGSSSAATLDRDVCSPAYYCSGGH